LLPNRLPPMVKKHGGRLVLRDVLGAAALWQTRRQT
jgi:hypothetical protein